MMFLIKDGGGGRVAGEIFKVGADTMEDNLNVATDPDNCEHFWLSCICFLILEWSLYFSSCFFYHIVDILFMLLILDCTGYIDRQSSNGNQYFDDKLKISSKEYQLVRIMKRGNYTITRRYLPDMLSCPVTMKSVTKTSGAVLFYNSCRGSSTVEARFMSFKYADS